jgi:SAM-dependent methyltransferase
MSNLDPSRVFYDQPNLITRDPRKDRYDRYNVNANFMTRRHQALLPANLVQGKSVLDLGCCVANTAGWCFAHGAASYVGVEINSDLCEAAEQNLQEYYPDQPWEIINLSVEDYFEKFGENRYDLIYYGGTIYADFDWIGQLQSLSRISDYIVLESVQPDIATYVDDKHGSFRQFLKAHPDILHILENTAPFVYLKEVIMFNGDQSNLLNYGSTASMGAFKQQMERLGYKNNTDCNKKLQELIPEWYHPTGRFGIHFYRDGDIDTNYLTVKELYENPDKRKKRIVPWKTHT